MGCSLVWRPIKETKSLSDELRDKVRAKYTLPRVFGASDLTFFETLALCGVRGAETVLKLIEKHGEIELLESW